MAKPVINTTQSVLGFLQWQEFAFQPSATNTPTSWTAVGLPVGVTITAGTGLIAGAAEKPGVYQVVVKAINGDGDSVPVVFTIGIEASVKDPLDNVIDVSVDLNTRVVTPYVPADAVFTAKRGDDLFLRVQFHRAGVNVAVTLTALKFTIKELDPEAVLVTSSAYSSLGDGAFLVYAAVTGDALLGALSNYEDDKATMFPATCELEWMVTHGLGIGPASARQSSLSFRGDIARDQADLTP